MYQAGSSAQCPMRVFLLVDSLFDISTRVTGENIVTGSNAA